MKCDSCHEYGMQWKTNSGLWTRPSPNHHAGQDCGGSGCHSSRDKLALRTPRSTLPAKPAPLTPPRTAPASPAPRSGPATLMLRAAARSMPAGVAPGDPTQAPFSHAAVAGSACVGCHSSAQSGGKPLPHIATSNDCQSCHTTLGWLPVRVDHAQVTGTCLSCHDGRIAIGKASRHLPASAGCESCHTTNAWTPARFDHASVAPHACTVCHNSVRAIGMPRAHIPTAQQCDTCHGTLGWTPVKVDHTTLVASCASCHNNISATGEPPNHLATALGCATCHAYPDWSLIHFRHVSAAYPGAHRAALACTSCHSADTDKVPYPSAADAGTCAACHARDFKPAAHPRTSKGVLYGAHELANCTGACHVYSDATQSTITRSLPGPHHRVSDATFKR
jgi:hypothetical protein